jgi:hypothetical protein
MLFILNSQLLLALNMFSTEYVGFLVNYNIIFMLRHAQFLLQVTEEELKVLLRIYETTIRGRHFFKHEIPILVTKTNKYFEFHCCMINLLRIKTKPGFIFMRIGTHYNTVDNTENKITN